MACAAGLGRRRRCCRIAGTSSSDRRPERAGAVDRARYHARVPTPKLRPSLLAVALLLASCGERPRTDPAEAEPEPAAVPLDETGNVPARVGAASLASVRAWAHGRAADDARYLEILRADASTLGTSPEVALPRVPAGDAHADGGALHVLIRHDAIFVGVVDSGLAPRAWRKVATLGEDGMPAASAMRGVAIEALRIAIDARWRAATRLCISAGVSGRVWLAIAADADVPYKAFLAVYATADAVGLTDIRLLAQGPRGLGTVSLRTALDVSERGTAATPRAWIGTETVVLDPGIASCADGARPCAVAPLASLAVSDCVRAGLAAGGARDFLVLAADPAAHLGDVVRVLSTCRSAPRSVLIDLPIRLSGNRGATVDCHDGHIACAN